MTLPQSLSQFAHTGLALLAALVLGYVGRVIARRLGQPAVVGEIAVGIGVGPVLLATVGRDVFDVLLPEQVSGALKLIGQAGLVLFLVGVAHELDVVRATRGSRKVSLVGIGSFVPPLLIGAGFAGWLLRSDERLVPTTSPSAFVLVVAVCFAVTAVPVLARILVERGMMGTPAAQLALTVAAVGDALAWVLLAVAIGLASGGFSAAVVAVVLLVAGAGVAFLVRRKLSAPTVGDACERSPRLAALALGASALIIGLALEHHGLTAVVGAVLVGFAIPRGAGAAPSWSRVVHDVTRTGNFLVPVFFVATGIGVLASPMAAPGWEVIMSACVLACLAKLGGVYAGARLGGLGHWESTRIGVLMNARGLTEFVFLQAAFSVGILPPAMFGVLAVMALITTALTGPLLTLTARVEVRGIRSSPIA